MAEKTIAAISTPSGEGGIGVIRISGADSAEICDRVFKNINGKTISSLSGYTALFGHIFDGDTLLDEAVVTRFVAPHSYTGEDVCEISCHGGAVVLSLVLRAVLSAGAILAAPGEFTKRAFLNGKLDLAEAESVMGLISSKSEQELKMNIAAKSGRVSKEIEKAEKALITLAANFAAYSDYPDEDLPELQPEAFESLLLEAGDILEKLLSTYDSGKIICDGIKTAIVGKPNVGKSTLMNLLVGEARSIVTSIAGTTRDVIEERIKCGNLTLTLADTAGIHASSDTVESVGVELAKSRIETAQLILAVFDASEPLDSDDLEILSLVKDKKSIVILNKTDKADVILPPDGFKTVKISAKEGMGADELTAAIEETVGMADIDSSAAVILSERQRDLADKALGCVREAMSLLKSGYAIDAVSVCVDDALGFLYTFDGKRVTNEVADEVFRRFCVGK
ncbi:MAG: tRNA uridine-5-carboxymethylaminomethyl(34) synthesis GTPase MnmE [Clostridia bacterium]|nr:tRNA uridine-5-carboxymethylaminomethyl(34) synthesis GTPase MnmE [Clostridia bacterium]